MTTPTEAERQDLASVETLVRASGSSFYRGMAMLPADRRHAMYAIYAFCRIVDDIADEPGAFAEKLRLLNDWRGRIAALYRGRAEDSVTRGLLRAIQAFQLRRVDFDDIIDGMQMDAQTTIVAPDLATLDLYCDRVAAAVGRLSVRAFGDSSPAADRVAHHLGRALQLTNILRDLHEDAERGRLYLPSEILAGAGVPLTPRAALAHPALPGVCAWMVELARDHFQDARTAMRQCDSRAMRPARLMAGSYAAVLGALERRGWRALDRKVSLQPWEKLWVVLRHGLW